MASSSTPAFLKSTDSENSTRPAGDGTAAAEKKPARGTPRWVLFAGFGILLLATAAAGFFYMRHRSAGKTGKSGPSSVSTSAKAAAAEPVATVELPLDPFVVNLADAGGHSYARIGLTLALAAPEAAKAEKKEGAAEPGPRDMVRDTVITVLNQEQSADLLAPDGKEHLKQAIRAAVAARSPQLRIADIYFTEFLVQP